MNQGPKKSILKKNSITQGKNSRSKPEKKYSEKFEKNLLQFSCKLQVFFKRSLTKIGRIKKAVQVLIRVTL